MVCVRVCVFENWTKKIRQEENGNCSLIKFLCSVVRYTLVNIRVLWTYEIKTHRKMVSTHGSTETLHYHRQDVKMLFVVRYGSMA